MRWSAGGAASAFEVCPVSAGDLGGGSGSTRLRVGFGQVARSRAAGDTDRARARAEARTRWTRARARREQLWRVPRRPRVSDTHTLLGAAGPRHRRQMDRLQRWLRQHGIAIDERLVLVRHSDGSAAVEALGDVLPGTTRASRPPPPLLPRLRLLAGAEPPLCMLTWATTVLCCCSPTSRHDPQIRLPLAPDLLAVPASGAARRSSARGPLDAPRRARAPTRIRVSVGRLPRRVSSLAEWIAGSPVGRGRRRGRPSLAQGHAGRAGDAATRLRQGEMMRHFFFLSPRR